MRSSSLAGQIVAVLSRRTPAFQLRPMEPTSVSGRLRAVMVARSAKRTPNVLPPVNQPSSPNSARTTADEHAQPESWIAYPRKTTPVAMPADPDGPRPARAIRPMGVRDVSTGLEDVSFLTVAEVAGLMRVSKMTVHRMIHSGELTAVRVGRSFRVPAQAVREYLSGSADPAHLGDNNLR